ncbi:hypothetical protein FO440_04815 [Mucilaginibacter corticis]|uniref:Alpha-L-rhamnosidase six-hairpin glycosidase domain-containing protein n=1 Tax=Mucilaginibacter corticis TaxID=2597670 RepID=A0A556MU92_9SPHI|nr:hypothetical protein [Mucilaginibacter corticis]TSJ43514.1 hypothetical protein FO440_04815 [Mucilaginibacter corticis]
MKRISFLSAIQRLKISITCFFGTVLLSIGLKVNAQQINNRINLPDSLIVEAYEKAADQNILAAVNPKIFFGYFSVCADGQGFGYGNTYPSLDGHQMSDALLWLNRPDVVKANWAYVKSFQKAKGELPIAIMPTMAGKEIGPKGFETKVDGNGGLYKHWVPGNPLRALAGTTYIQNADVIYRFTQDKNWLKKQISSVNLSADYLSKMVTKEGLVGGAGYYLERPTRIEFDGVAQCHVADAFFRLSVLNKVVKDDKSAFKYKRISDLIRANFRKRFWVGDHFAEYINPDKGIVSNHGLTDCDWSAVAFGLASKQQQQILWKLLQHEKQFYYDEMPTGIATKPDSYEKWESTYSDNQDLAAMGRVWYIEACARAAMNDPEGLIETLLMVSKKGEANNWYWRERYNKTGGYGAEKYNEYPANLVRIIQRFVFGVNFDVNGTLIMAPIAPERYWQKGFGQTLSWNNRSITYMLSKDKIQGSYVGSQPQKITIRLRKNITADKRVYVVINKIKHLTEVKNGCISFKLPGGTSGKPSYFYVIRS